MNMEQTKEAIRALSDNPDVEVSVKGFETWRAVSDMKFRIKPKPVEAWMVVNPDTGQPLFRAAFGSRESATRYAENCLAFAAYSRPYANLFRVVHVVEADARTTQ